MAQEPVLEPSVEAISADLRKLRVRRGVSIKKLRSAQALLSLKSVRRQATVEGRNGSLPEVAYEVLECFLRTKNDEVKIEGAQRTVYVELNFERRQNVVSDRQGEVAYELGVMENYRGHSLASYEAVAFVLRDLEISPCARDEVAVQKRQANEVLLTNEPFVNAIVEIFAGMALAKENVDETLELIGRRVHERLPNGFRTAGELASDFWPDTDDELEVLRGMVHKIVSSRTFVLSRARAKRLDRNSPADLTGRQLDAVLFPSWTKPRNGDPTIRGDRRRVYESLRLLAGLVAFYELGDRWIEVLLDDNVNDRVIS